MADSWFRKLLGPPDPSGRRRKPLAAPEPPRPATTASRTNPYQAVAIIACSRACAAAAQVQGVRFLARQAPRLPLADCDRTGTCACRFEKHADRRAVVQRSPYNNSGVVSFGGAERRRLRGRRATDR
jgi:hypothetical protein